MTRGYEIPKDAKDVEWGARPKPNPKPEPSPKDGRRAP